MFLILFSLFSNTINNLYFLSLRRACTVYKFLIYMEFEPGFIIRLTHNVCHLENNRNLLNFFKIQIKITIAFGTYTKLG